MLKLFSLFLGFEVSQLISKGLCGILGFFQKLNETIRLDYYDTSGRLFFVPFLQEFEDSKKTFRS